MYRRKNLVNLRVRRKLRRKKKKMQWETRQVGSSIYGQKNKKAERIASKLIGAWLTCRGVREKNLILKSKSRSMRCR